MVSYDFRGKTAVVIGASKGIGRRIAERLRDARANVWNWDVAPSGTEGIAQSRVDVTNTEQIAWALTEVVGQTSRIDILVNSAGYLGAIGPFEQYERDAWHKVISANLVGVLEVCGLVVPQMRRTGTGRIVNLGSLAGKDGLRNLSVYSAASAGVIAFTKALGRELADTDIRVNCVAPGPIDTEMIRNLGPEVVNAMIAASPVKRLGTVDEVAEIVLWLCSEACSFSTGAVFDVSGGRATY